MSNKVKLENIEEVKDSIKKAYGYIDLLNTTLMELVEVTKVDKEDPRYGNYVTHVEEFYLALPTYHCLDDLKRNLDFLQEAYEQE